MTVKHQMEILCSEMVYNYTFLSGAYNTCVWSYALKGIKRKQVKSATLKRKKFLMASVKSLSRSQRCPRLKPDLIELVLFYLCLAF